MTCIFSINGELIDLIPGAAKETFLYSEEAIKTMKTTDFHLPNRFNMNKKRIIPHLNNLLQQKQHLDKGIYMASELNQLIDSLHYPYSMYLKLVGELIKPDTINSRLTAKLLINLETPYDFELYKNEFITAKKVIDPDFDINAEPNIRVDNKNILLENCNVNESVPINIAIYNDGIQPLKISKIHLSCSCLEHTESNKEIIIESKKNYIVKFFFTPDHAGEISRDIFIASNAINVPVLHINILAKTINNSNN